MKIKVYVQSVNLVQSHVVGRGKYAQVTLTPLDNEQWEKAGFEPQTSLLLNASDPSAFPAGSERTIEI